MAKRTGDSESDLPQKRARFEDTGTPHRSEAPSFAKRRLRLQQVSPRRVRMQQIEFSVEASQYCGVKIDERGSQQPFEGI